MLRYIDKKYRFGELFNPKTGFQIRTGILEQKDGKMIDTDVDPFMRSFPALIDIGIMGKCQHGLSGLCLQSSTDCYQSGNKIVKENMSLDNYTRIINQCTGKTFQVALGGRGDVNKHENFAGILEATRNANVIPSYTTSGLELYEEEVLLSKEYCGAVAVSWYRHQHTHDAIYSFIEEGVKTNIHFVLSSKSIDEAIELIQNDGFPKGINAVIFLLYKPVGEGKDKYVLKTSELRLLKFFDLIDKFEGDFKIGFDSCSIPGIINYTKNVNTMFTDTCEGARFSAYISADMKMVPCSFDQDHIWSVDLNKHSIQDVWNGSIFDSFRDKLKSSCPNCEDRVECYGGCPIKPQIVLCNREERDEN